MYYYRWDYYFLLVCVRTAKEQGMDGIELD